MAGALDDEDRQASARAADVGLVRGRNLRDLGDYATGTGARVRRGLVYRSAALADDDGEWLERLGIALIVDFRSSAERRAEAPVTSITRWVRDYDSSDGDLVGALVDPATTVSGVRDLMAATYRSLLGEQAEAYGELFRRIARGELPVLFHCAAGKDRTGIAAALLLALLGVSRADIEADYLLTGSDNERAFGNARRSLERHGIVGVEEAVFAALMSVDRLYLEAMFDELDRRFGDVETYAYRQLGLTTADLGAMRNRLLIPEEDDR